jgi:hypothetical protein
MLSTLLLAAWLVAPAGPSPAGLQSLYITHEGDDSLGLAFVAAVKQQLGKRGVQLPPARTGKRHTLVAVSIRAVSEHTSRQMGSVIALTLLRPDDSFVKMWVYTLNHTPGHAESQAANFAADLDRVKAAF